MDELQERYDELDTIENSLRRLIHEISDKYIKDELYEIMFEAQDEKKEIEPRLQAMYDREEKEREREYWRDAI